MLIYLTNYCNHNMILKYLCKINLSIRHFNEVSGSKLSFLGTFTLTIYAPNLWVKNGQTSFIISITLAKLLSIPGFYSFNNQITIKFFFINQVHCSISKSYE